MANQVPIPAQDPIARTPREKFRQRNERDPQDGLVTDPWRDYFTQMGLGQSQSSSRVGQPVQLSTQSASIGATDFSGGTLAGGLYRINYYVRVTQAASVSSSITVSFDWSDGGVAITYPGTAEAGNTTATYHSDTFPIHVDSLSPIRYSTTYASVGGTPMQYQLFCVLEAMPL